MKERIISIFVLLFAALTVCMIVIDLPKKNYAKPASDFTEAVRNGNPADTPLAVPSAATGGTTSPAVANEVIRLHILADSDSERDQAVKLALRDVLLPYLNAATLDAKTKEEALDLLEAQCPALTDIANAALTQFNAGYSATVSVDRVYFPIRIYGSQTYLSADAVLFPPGFYDSVQVVLGSGEGHNWWCLAYPSLCFIDSAYDYIPKNSDIYKLKIGTLREEKLEQLFWGKQASLLPVTDTPASDDEITLCFSFKLWELLKNFWKTKGY